MDKLLRQEEIVLAKECMEFALRSGADAVRITLNKNLTDLVGILNGEVDKVSHSLDRSLQIALFVDGRYGAFSSNRLEKSKLEEFVLGAIGTVKMLEEDKFRKLPEAERKVKGVSTGMEPGLYDPACLDVDETFRRKMAMDLSLWKEKESLEKGFTILSEEAEYSDSVSDLVVMDSDGLYARHCETAFEIVSEFTIADPDGRLFSGYWWDSSWRLAGVDPSACARKALERTVEQMNPMAMPGGKYSVVVDSECASRLLSPVLSALGGFAVQQNNSFLADDLGRKVFAEKMTLVDLPLEKGATGARLFDSEGVATREMPVIDHGVVKTFFLNTYIAGKMGMEPTVEDSTRVKLMPVGECRDIAGLMAAVGEGILITGFNGGNSNAATGDFSYGIEGFYFRDGRIVHPVRELLMTGNFKTLWNSLSLVADDARPCLVKQIPSLVFSSADMSA
ncbi:MAG: TldD/PmbA family protein [Bacteroidales bacterium]|nr:TldD/PmbA family protein [Bacteroidales bacterium]